jgi:hypothetical protein
MKQLTLMNKQEGNGFSTWTLLAWHWKWSVTWRWGIWLCTRKTRRFRAYFYRIYRGMGGLNFNCGLDIPFVGQISVQTQPNMRIRKCP